MKSEAFGKWASILLKNFTYGVVPRGGARAQEAFVKMTETAKTFDDWFTLNGCAHLMWEDKLEQVALDKMIETAETFDDWLQIFNNNRWESILVKMSETAKTLKDWRIVWQWSLHFGGDLRWQAEKEMVTLARNSQTFNDWHNAYRLTGPRISYSSDLGDTSCWPSEIHRVNQLAWAKMFETAKTFHNWLDIYPNLSLGSQLENQVLTKMFETAKTSHDLLLILDYISDDHAISEYEELKELVLAKMKELQATEY